MFQVQVCGRYGLLALYRCTYNHQHFSQADLDKIERNSVNVAVKQVNWLCIAVHTTINPSRRPILIKLKEIPLTL